MSMTPLIDSDDELVADLLAGTLQLIAETGGWISPYARIVARDGQLSMTCDEGDGAPLLNIPREMLVPVDEVTWTTESGQLQVIDLPDDLGAMATEVVYLQVALHNRCGKLPWMSRTHPSLATDLSERAIEATRALVPSFRAGHHDVADVLWANRCFRLPLRGEAARPRILVPIVDLLNHHTKGASGDWDGRTFAVAACRPFGTNECALDYGMSRDALELAAAYGFIDESAEVAHSAAVAIDVPGLGPVKVDVQTRSADGSTLALISQDHPDQTVLNALSFSIHGDDLMREQLSTVTGWSQSTVTRAIDGIREANLALVADMMQACSDLMDSAAAQTLAGAGRVHGRILGSGRSSVRS